MSFQRYAQMGPVTRNQKPTPQPATYGNFMMQMMPMMMQQARTMMQPPMPTPEQQQGVGQSPLGYNPTLDSGTSAYGGSGTGPMPQSSQQPPPRDVPPGVVPESVPVPLPEENPQGSYRRGVLLAMMREGLGR
jgi:hypothetical protein